MKRSIQALATLFLYQALTAGVNAQYAVIHPGTLTNDIGWMNVVSRLASKYSDSSVYTYDRTPLELEDALAQARPRYVCLVLQPQQVDQGIVSTMHRLSRALDDDPYGDCLWGIITGYRASDALRIAEASSPLAIHRAFGTTGFRTAPFSDALIISDSKRGDVVQKSDNGEVLKTTYPPTAPEGVTHLLESFWKEKRPQLFVTSGHATQYNLEMSWGQGLVTCHENRFYALRRDQAPQFARFLNGVMFKGSERDVANYVAECEAPALVSSENVPKVWLGAGNCLLGDANSSSNTMVVTALSAGGFNQLVGYTDTTWYGRMGWGTLGRFQGAQRPTLSEAFFLNNQALLDESERRYPGLLNVSVKPEGNFFQSIRTPGVMQQIKHAGLTKLDRDAMGLLHDRDTVAFFGDPRWEARIPRDGDAPNQIEMKLIEHGLELHIRTSDAFKPNAGFDVIFPRPLQNPKLDVSDEWKIRLTDDFLLVRQSDLRPGQTRTVTIRSAGTSRQERKESDAQGH